MTTIHIVTGGKGNVGKTAFASLLRCLAVQAGANPQLVDADDKKQTLSKIYSNSASVFPIVLSDDPAEDSQPDLIWHIAERNQRDVIVDMAAQSDSYITEWIESRGVVEMSKENNIQIIKWWVADLDPDSFTDLLNLCDDYDHSIQHVLVKSQHRAKDSKWEGAISLDERLNTAINAGKLPAITFPRLSSGLIDKMRVRDKQFYECIVDDENKLLDMLSRSTVMRWVARCKAEVDPVFQFTKAGQSKANPSDEPSAVATVEVTTSDEPTKRHKQEVLLEQCLEKKANKSEA